LYFCIFDRNLGYYAKDGNMIDLQSTVRGDWKRETWHRETGQRSTR